MIHYTAPLKNLNPCGCSVIECKKAYFEEAVQKHDERHLMARAIINSSRVANTLNQVDFHFRYGIVKIFRQDVLQ